VRYAGCGPEWRNWQTHETQNLAPVTRRVGSIPSSGTNLRSGASILRELRPARVSEDSQLITAESHKPMTHIGASVAFDGTLTCEEDLTIEGKLTGNIHLRDATLIVAQPALLEADIRAARVVIHGTVTGSISAAQRIELAPSAKVTGDLSAIQVVIAQYKAANA
jgi:cytoskeletal protein CcmA (bactofilin family)